ncbi:MAG TPA: vWA domain-containing protein, partial [Blastocatellia bacterium]|nr:vWA domain-containing protein [Blastocatellia bacterium]
WKTMFGNALLLCAVMLVVFGFTRSGAGVIEKPKELVDDKDSNGRKTLEMVFALDTTGSMGGLIEGAKQRIWGIVNEVMQSESRPNVRIGLVAYRDIGDRYVTEIFPVTDNLDAVYTTLMDYRAEGGGDTPENVRRALAQAVHKAGWAQQSNQAGRIAQVVFLVGDAPPHNDYQDEPDTKTTAVEAKRRGMIVNAIQCGNISGTREVWQEIAQYGGGRYFAIPQDSGVVTIVTPYDEKLGALSNQLGGTYLAYGAEDVQSLARTRQAVAESKIAAAAPASAQADRAMNKAINSRAYDGDLLQGLENGTMKLEDVKPEELPEELRRLSPEERKQEIEKRLAQRRQIRADIMRLSKDRAEFIKKERAKSSAKNSFDSVVAEALKEQLAARGFK